MQLRTYLPVFLLALLLFGNINTSNSQTSVKQTKLEQTQLQEIDYSDMYVYKSPSKAFNDLHLQKYKDLPRFGSCDFYMTSRNSPVLTKEAGLKRKLLNAGYTSFRKLALMHLLKDHFKFLDKEAVTPRATSKDYTEQEIKSYNTQRILKELARNCTTDAVKRAYFCQDPTRNNCAKNSNKWGGYNSDDFTENEKYVDFVANHYEELTQWSTDFFKDGSERMYLSSQVKFNSNGYDFDKNGYWLALPIRGAKFYHDYTGTQDQYFYEFSPETPYGNELLNKTSQVKYINGEVLFSISPEKAEALVNKRLANLYLVSKVKVVFKGIDETNPTFPTVSYTYHFESPLVEIFEDPGLTQKVGEISLDNLTYKGD